MKLERLVVILATLVAASMARAEEATEVQEKIPVVGLSAANFDTINENNLAGENIMFSNSWLTFQDWKTTQPAEHAVLGLFKNYTEPMVTEIENGVLTPPKAEPLHIWVSRLKKTLNVSPRAVTGNLAKFVNIEEIRKLDPAMQITQIKEEQTLPVVVANKQPINAFANCVDENQEPWVKQVKAVREFDALAGKRFCEASQNRICLETCVSVGSHKDLVSRVSKMRGHYEDPGLAFQSELTTYASEKAYDASVSLSSLTKMNTEVVAVVEQKIFYVDHMLKFGKILFVFNRHPSDPNKVILTTYVALGVKQRSVDTYNNAAFRALGLNIDYLLNRGVPGSIKGSLLSGVPKYSISTMANLSKMLEQN